VYLRDQGLRYHGFDISAEAVAQAQAHGLHAELLTEDGKTSLPNGCCDVAVCFEVFEHLMEPHVALAEIARVLSPRGVLLASVPNAAHWFQRGEFLVSGFFNPGGSLWTARKRPWADPHIRFFSPSTFRRFFLANGFGQVEILTGPFTLEAMPYVYRQRVLKTTARYVSKPFRWLNQVSPGLFGSGLYARAQLKAPDPANLEPKT
jgi:SAM-dependent methyltransferase